MRASEGVFGLRRAFQIAGARTVIMSLWSVEDDATRLWMRALYEGRLTKKLDPADAVHAASVSVLRRPSDRPDSPPTASLGQRLSPRVIGDSHAGPV